MAIHVVSEPVQLTRGLRKERRAWRMIERARGFLAAGILLHQSEKRRFEYVVLHLVGQGIENLAKGYLLLKDYDKFDPVLRECFRHDLMKVTQRALKEYGLKELRPGVAQELSTLN